MRCSPAPSQKASPAAQLPNIIIQKEASPGCRWSLRTGPLPNHHKKVPDDTGSDTACPPVPVETYVLGGWSGPQQMMPYWIVLETVEATHLLEEVGH